MSSPQGSIWYEIRPNGQAMIGTVNPQRFGDQAAAEAAGRRMRERYPDFRFVEIVRYEARDGKESGPTSAGRV
jgi:hypothetical protein